VNRRIVKRVMIELLVVLVVIVIGFEAAVLPAKLNAMQAGAELSSLVSEQASLGKFDANRESRARAAHDAVLLQARKLNDISNEAAEPSRLYERYYQAATQSGVRLDRIDPAPRSRQSATANGIESSGYTLGVSGSYSNVSRFLEIIQYEFGLATVLALRMVPDPAAGTDNALDRVIVTIETAHFRMIEPLQTQAAANTGGLGGGQ
jgi:Tfp pilus assembly protein PilO